jgi:hypothetical protein
MSLDKLEKALNVLNDIVLLIAVIGSIIMFDAVCSLWPLQRRLTTIVLTENLYSCCSCRGFATLVALILRRRFVTSSPSRKYVSLVVTSDQETETMEQISYSGRTKYSALVSKLNKL